MVQNFLSYLTHEKRYSRHTITAYRDDLNSFHNFLSATFEITDDAEVQHAHLRGWIVELMESGISPRSVNRKIATLKSYFKFLYARAYATANPASRLRPLKTEKKLPSFVKESEMIDLLDKVAFEESFFGVRDRLLIELFYATGIRLAELIGLKETDIDSVDQTIKVLGKRNKERIIPIGPQIVTLIKSYQALKRDMWTDLTHRFLLVTDRGDQMYPMMVYRIIKQYLGKVTTLSKRSPHVLRHTFATHLLDKGADLNAVKDLLGHTSLAATQVYTHNSLDKLKSVFDQAHPKA
ncbi:MAG: integrase/recombinase XerC [Cyclobacteriaceae bacterium]|jgi:integrase/recombinase XerC